MKYLSVNPWVCHRNFGPENFGPTSVTGSGERETELDAQRVRAAQQERLAAETAEQRDARLERLR